MHAKINNQKPANFDATPPGKKNRSLVRQVIDSLDSFSRTMSMMQSAMAKAAGLRGPNYALLKLAVGVGNQGITVSDAAQRLGVRPQALSTPTAELVEAGLLERIRDPRDGRARLLRPTAAAYMRLDRAERLQERLLSEVAAQIPAANVASLIISRLESAIKRALT
ncbi:MAG: MarR family transcriptional regulator [Desulfarculaceae bacterium]